jgi:hypothetical protein
LAKLLSLDHTWQSSCHWIILGKALVTGSLIFGVIGFAVGITWALYGFGKLAVADILAIVANATNLFSVSIVFAILKPET